MTKICHITLDGVGETLTAVETIANMVVETTHVGKTRNGVMGCEPSRLCDTATLRVGAKFDEKTHLDVFIRYPSTIESEKGRQPAISLVDERKKRSSKAMTWTKEEGHVVISISVEGIYREVRAPGGQDTSEKSVWVEYQDRNLILVNTQVNLHLPHSPQSPPNETGRM